MPDGGRDGPAGAERRRRSSRIGRSPAWSCGSSPGNGPAKTFSGTPIFDACTVLPFDVVRASGIELDASDGPGPFMRTARMTADGQDDPNSRGSVADAGVTRCEYPGSRGELLTFTIYQAPFDSPNSRDGQEKSLRQGGREGQAAGWRTLSIANTELHIWTTGIFADDFYAVIHLNARDTPQPENPRMTRLVENVAERLHAPPTGSATYSYEAEFAHVRSPCEIFTSADFQQAIGFGTDGRTTGEFDLAKKHISPDPMSGTTGQSEYFYVTTACTQENQSAVNSEVGTTPAQSVTVTMENYLTPEMAAEANDYDCALGKGYRHPRGEPKAVPFSVGDGLACLVDVGGSQSRLAFKAGRSTVELNVFYARNLKDNDTAIRVYTSVAARLAEREPPLRRAPGPTRRDARRRRRPRHRRGRWHASTPAGTASPSSSSCTISRRRAAPRQPRRRGAAGLVLTNIAGSITCTAPAMTGDS